MAAIAETLVTQPVPQRRRLSFARVGDVLAHGYIWLWLAVFALPFVATSIYSLRTPTGEWSLSAYQYVLGSFKENLLLSAEVTILTIILNMLIAIPAAYAIVRYPIPGKSFLLSWLSETCRPSSRRRRGPWGRRACKRSGELSCRCWGLASAPAFCSPS